MSRRAVAAVVVAAALIGVWFWQPWLGSDERQIRRRLDALANDFNESTTDGLGAVARAAKFGSYFAGDVVIEFGHGTPPVRGRETVIGMAARLQPRTAAFTLQLLDVNVTASPPAAAEVNLTAAFRRRSLDTGEESVDAQELLLGMVKVDGEWRIQHVTAVESFK